MLMVCAFLSFQATARLVEYVAGGFGRTAALMHIKANATEDMRLTDSRVAGEGKLALFWVCMLMQ
jgi:hypothetical protein